MSFELELCLSMTYRVGVFVPSDRAKMEESTLPLELFLSCYVGIRKMQVSAEERSEREGT